MASFGNSVDLGEIPFALMARQLVVLGRPLRIEIRISELKVFTAMTSREHAVVNLEKTTRSSKQQRQIHLLLIDGRSRRKPDLDRWQEAIDRPQ